MTKQPQDTTSPRVLRGGGWGSFPKWVRAAKRITDEPTGCDYDFGFRCALKGREPRVTR